MHDPKDISLFEKEEDNDSLAYIIPLNRSGTHSKHSLLSRNIVNIYVWTMITFSTSTVIAFTVVKRVLDSKYFTSCLLRSNVWHLNDNGNC